MIGKDVKETKNRPWPAPTLMPSALEVGGDEALPLVKRLLNELMAEPALAQVRPSRTELLKMIVSDSDKPTLCLRLHFPPSLEAKTWQMINEMSWNWFSALPEHEKELLTNLQRDFLLDPDPQTAKDHPGASWRIVSPAPPGSGHTR